MTNLEKVIQYAHQQKIYPVELSVYSEKLITSRIKIQLTYSFSRIEYTFGTDAEDAATNLIKMYGYKLSF